MLRFHDDARNIQVADNEDDGEDEPGGELLLLYPLHKDLPKAGWGRLKASRAPESCRV